MYLASDAIPGLLLGMAVILLIICLLALWTFVPVALANFLPRRIWVSLSPRLRVRIQARAGRLIALLTHGPVRYWQVAVLAVLGLELLLSYAFGQVDTFNREMAGLLLVVLVGLLAGAVAGIAATVRPLPPRFGLIIWVTVGAIVVATLAYSPAMARQLDIEHASDARHSQPASSPELKPDRTPSSPSEATTAAPQGTPSRLEPTYTPDVLVIMGEEHKVVGSPVCLDDHGADPVAVTILTPSEAKVTLANGQQVVLDELGHLSPCSHPEDSRLELRDTPSTAITPLSSELPAETVTYQVLAEVLDHEGRRLYLIWRLDARSIPYVHYLGLVRVDQAR